MNLFRIYEPHECGADGYPLLWHSGVVEKIGSVALVRLVPAMLGRDDQHTVGVKDLVRERAGHRCERCGHPFKVGQSGVTEGNPEAACISMRDYELLRLDGDNGFPEPMSGGSDSVKGGPRVNWSPCDEHCAHGGPMRFRRHPDAEWQHEDDLGPGQRSTGWGARHGLETQAAWRILTVHHLNGRKFDLRWHNLVALCQRCHLVIQKKVQMEQVWPTEHSEWFKPYAAGWYSYAYEGIERTRDEVMADLDRLLALERVV